MPADHGTCHPALALGFLVAILLVATVSIAGYRRRRGSASDPGGALLGGTLRGWYRETMEPAEAALVRAGVSAHALTGGQLVLSVAAGICFALGAVFLGGVLVLGCGTLDVLDGGVARRAGRAGREGAFLDSVADRYAEAATFLGLAIFFHASMMLWVVIVGLVGSFMVSYARARAEGLGVECPRGLLQRPERYVLLGMGSLFSVIVVHLACPLGGASRHYLLGGVVILLALLAHVSAAQRIRATRIALREGAGGEA